jgi:hypothetical protein
VRGHGAVFGLILLAVAAAYAHLSGAWFCGYDDFNESYRAVFFDGTMPSRIVTAGHFTPFMYRPVTSALQLATWDAGHGALAFRIRNLATHLLSVALVYGIAFFLGRSRAAAAAAAALFGMSPFTNEAVAVAIWTNTTAYALLLGSLFAFFLAFRALSERRAWGYALGVSLLAALVALFTYEPTIVVFAIMFAYLALCARPVPLRGFLSALAAGMALDLAIFFGVRHAVGITGAPLLPAGTIVKNLIEYLVGLALPIDPVLAHALFGIPLPASSVPLHVEMLLPAALFALALVVAVALVIGRPVRERFATLPWATLAFLAISIPLSLVPIVLYRDHVSEYNLYVPAALYSIAVALGLRHLARSRAAFAAVTGLLLVSYVAGTVVRNERVVACARIAQTIVGSLPTGAWRDGAWDVRLATTPGKTLPPRYGIYDYAGIETLEVTQTHIRGAEDAVRLATGNERVRVDVVSAETLEDGCARPRTCYTVSANGDVSEVFRSKVRSK